MQDQALPNTAPAHRTYEMSFIFFASWAAGLLRDARVSALKYPAWEQNVSNVVHSSASWQAALLRDEGSSPFTIPVSVDIG